MRGPLIVSNIAAAVAVALLCESASAMQAERNTEPSDVRIPTASASLHARTIGQGQPVIVLHGGPDFDYGYLLPELDRLKDAFRLIYYDHIARAIPNARFVTIKECGHFAYLECAGDVRSALDEFFRRSTETIRPRKSRD